MEIKKKRKFEENCFFAFEEAKKLLSNSGMSLEPLIDFMIENVSMNCFLTAILLPLTVMLFTFILVHLHIMRVMQSS